MAYVKNIWVDQDVERPKTYEVTNNQDGSITLTDSFGIVTELGTPVNETNMNHIEDGIAGAAIRKHNLTETFELNEWVLGGSGNTQGLYKSLVANNVGNAITDTTKWEKVSLGGGYEVGDFVWRSLPTEDDGKHLCDGALIQGGGVYDAFVNKIADLYANNPTANYFTDETTWQNTVTTYGSCGKFVYDSVNNTVRLPKVSDILEGTTDVNALGSLVEAGLPNITGTVYGYDFLESMVTAGAFYNAGNTGLEAPAGGSGNNQILGIDASRSSALYKNNFNKVQPQTIKALLYIVIATSTKTDIESDIDQIATDLNGKADTDLTNVTTTGRELINKLSIPRNGIALTLGASGSTYTAPSDGWFALGKRANGTGQFLAGFNATTSQRFCMTANFSGGECFSLIPARKGDTVGFDYSAGGEVVSFYFHPLTTT